ncbi:MAG: SMC family ATPase, partial [Armatimonadetes bacterium]|nr:SMC family ATPase [Armatimonadota bacterium]
DIQFETGLTAIVGPNGSGKTTILEAISWALYGEHRDKKETIRNMWAEADEPTSIRLHFSLSGREFMVERDLKNAKLVEAGEQEQVLSSGLRPVTQGAERLLGLNYEQFKNSFGTEQKDLAFLNFATPGRQQEEIARMLGFDRLRRAASLGKERARDARNTLAGMQAVLAAGEARETDMKEAQAAAGRAGGALKEAETSLKVQEKLLKDLEPKRKRAEEALSLLRSMKERADLGRKLKRDIERIEERLRQSLVKRKERDALEADSRRFEELENERRELAKQQTLARQRASLDARLKDASERRDAVLAELEKTPEPGLKALGTELDEVKETAERLEAQVDERRTAWRKERSEIEKRIAVLERDVKTLSLRLEELQTAAKDGVCPTCGQSLPEGRLPEQPQVQVVLDEKRIALREATESETTLASEPAEVQALKRSLAEASERVRQLEQRLRDAQIQTSLRNEKRTAVDETEGQIAKLTDQLRKLPGAFDEAHWTRVEEGLAQLRPSWQRYQQMASLDVEIERAERDRAAADADFGQEKEKQRAAERKLQQTGFAQEEAERLIRECEAAGEAVASAKTDAARAQTALDSARTAEERAERLVQEYHRQKKEAGELKKRERLLTEVQKTLEDLRRELNAQTLPLLEQFAGDFLSSLSGGRYMRITLDEKYQPTVWDDNLQKPVISGGEEDIVALSLRLALARMIQERSGQPLSLLILDEVFGSLDAERRRSVLDQLESLRGTFEQILIISHIEEINEAADRCLTVRYDPETRQSFVEESVPELAVV